MAGSDYMSQGNQGDQVFRDSPYVQVGGQQIRTPTSVNLSDMFKTPSTPSGQFDTPAGAQLPPITFDEPVGDVGGIDAGDFLESSAEWTKYAGIGGDYYMPTAGKTGDFHQGPDGQLYEWREGQGWVGIEGGAGGDEATQRLNEFKGAVSSNTLHITGNIGILDNAVSSYSSYGTLVDGLKSGTLSTAQAEAQRSEAYAAEKGKIQQAYRDALANYSYSGPGQGAGEAYKKFEQQQNQIQQQALQKLKASNAKVENAIEGFGDGIKGLTQQASQLGIDLSNYDLKTAEDANAVKALIDQKLIGKDYVGLLEATRTTISQDFSTQITSMLEGIDTGDLQFFNEDGDLDLDRLRTGNSAEKWLAQTLDSATGSGFLKDDFMQSVQKVDENGVPVVDADGNPVMEEVFSEEIQGVMNSMDEEMSQQQQRFMQDLKWSAAQQGFSVRDVIFSESFNQYTDEATAQYANEFAGMLDREMDESYTSMANSFNDLLMTTVGAVKAQAFKDEVERQREQALANYQVQNQVLAEEMAQGQANTRSNVIIGLVSAAAAAFGVILG